MVFIMSKQGNFMAMTTLDFYLADVWKKTVDAVRDTHQVDDNIFNSFFNSSRLLNLDNNQATVISPQYVQTALLKQSRNLFETALSSVMGQEFVINFVTENGGEALTSQIKKFGAIENRFLIEDFSKKYTFENFVIGQSNVQAQIAALTIATNPGLVYNPLFIYGNSGLGKTHLLLAIGNKVLDNFPNKKIAYLSGSDFVDGVYKAAKDKALEEFKQSFQPLDLLLIDDIQFIAGKEKTHEIFFSVFNMLVNSEKQICLTADRIPSEISGLEERIISRFNQGLNVNIEAPEYETAVNILKRKIESLMIDSQNIDEDVISFIATNFSRDVRQLEGALNRLLFYAINFAPDKDVISLDVAFEAFRDSKPTQDETLSINLIKEVVGEYYGLTASQMASKNRTKNIATARHIAMYLSRKLLDAPYKDIGLAFGGRDHSTVINACEKIEHEIKVNDLYRKTIADIEGRII